MTSRVTTRTSFGYRKLAVNNFVFNVCSLRFLYINVLKRRDVKEGLSYAQRRQRPPVILNPGEVAQLIGSASNEYHRTPSMTIYSTGLAGKGIPRLGRGGGRSLGNFS